MQKQLGAIMSGNSGPEDIGITLFKRAGICLLDVQVIEKELSLLLLPTQTLTRGHPTKEAVDETQQTLWTMNIGELQRRCANLITKDGEFMFELDRVRKLRNRFVHDFFVSYMQRIPLISEASDAEIQEMIDELNTLHKRFIAFHERLVKITKKEYKGVEAAIKKHFGL